MLAALARLWPWRRSRGSAREGKQRIQAVREQEERTEARLKAEREKARREAIAAQIKRPPAEGEIIEQDDRGRLRLAKEHTSDLPRPAPAVFHLPRAGDRLAGLAYSPKGVLYALVQLLPCDEWWLHPGRFPERIDREVRIGGAVRTVQRLGWELSVREPTQGSGAGQWEPLSGL